MNNKHKITKKITAMVFAAAILLSPVIFTGCSSEFTDSEIKKQAGELVKASYEVNVIFFGEGLPPVDKASDEAKKFAAENSVNVDSVLYLPVDRSVSKYSVREEIMEAAGKVYTASYCSYLEEIAFSGVADDDTGTAVFARYIEDSSGFLTVKTDLSKSALALDRTYDTDSIEVVKNTKKEIRISVQSYVSGEKDDILEISLVNGEDGLRLDTPTY